MTQNSVTQGEYDKLYENGLLRRKTWEQTQHTDVFLLSLNKGVQRTFAFFSDDLSATQISWTDHFPTVTVAEEMSCCSATAVLVLRWTFTWLAAITTPTHEHSVPFFSVRISFSTAVLITHLSTPRQQWFVSFILHALQASDHPERRPRLVWTDKNWGTAMIHGAPQKTTFYRTEQTTEALWTDRLYAR